MDESQAWFWLPEWQRMEAEADEDLRLGRYKTFDSMEELIESLFAERNTSFERVGRIMREIKPWLGKHPSVVIALFVCIAIVLIAAMAFHYDLSWIPGMLVRAIWSGN